MSDSQIRKHYLIHRPLILWMLYIKSSRQNESMWKNGIMRRCNFPNWMQIVFAKIWQYFKHRRKYLSKKSISVIFRFCLDPQDICIVHMALQVKTLNPLVDSNANIAGRSVISEW